MITYPTNKLQKVLLSGGCEQNGTPTPTTPMDIICNNGVLKVRPQSGLPLGYTLLDYIESTGTQYIDTGVKFTGTTSIIEAGIVFTSASTDWRALSTTQSDTNTRWGGIQFKGSKVYATAGNLIGDNGAQLPITTNTRYNIKVETNVSTGKNKLTVNDATDTVDFAGSCYTNKNLLLFAKSTTIISEYASIKLYSYKLTIDNVLVRNFVPAKRNSDNVIGMYDTVSGNFFTNQGTGTFTAGSAVSDPVVAYADGTVETIEDTIGNTATAETLLKVGDYQDVQEILAGDVTRKVGVKVLDGTEVYQLYGSGTELHVSTSIAGKHAAQTGVSSLICSHFMAVADTTVGGVVYGQINCDSNPNYPTTIRIGINGLATTGAEFKAWVIDQYNAGTPVIIVYPLATPTTEQVTPQPLAGSSATVTAGSLDNLPIESSTIAELKKRYIGDKEVKRVYIGDNLVWS